MAVSVRVPFHAPTYCAAVPVAGVTTWVVGEDDSLVDCKAEPADADELLEDTVALDVGEELELELLSADALVAEVLAEDDALFDAVAAASEEDSDAADDEAASEEADSED